MIYLCLVSNQPIPNLLPALDPAVAPERMVLAVSPEMEQQARHLEEALSRHRVPTTRLALADAYDLPSLTATFVAFIDGHGNNQLALNVTGGTKPMAIAAQEAFRMAGLPVFYVDVRSDSLSWLDPGRPPIALTRGPNLSTYLLAHGYRSESNAQPLPPKWRPAVAELVQRAPQWGSAITRLNAIAAEADRSRSLDGRRIDNEVTGPWDEMLQMLFRHGIVDHYDDRRVRFASEPARAFSNGAWLEYYVHGVVRDLPEVKDAAMNLVVTDEQVVRNEMDSAFLHRNRLFVVECKTRQFGRDAARASDAIYKLDSLKRLAGLRTHGVFVSYRAIPPADRRRAEADGILVVAGNELPALAQKLQRFMGVALPPGSSAAPQS